MDRLDLVSQTNSSEGDERVFLYEVVIPSRQNKQNISSLYRRSRMLLRVPYQQMNQVMGRIGRLGGKIINITPLTPEMRTDTDISTQGYSDVETPEMRTDTDISTQGYSDVETRDPGVSTSVSSFPEASTNKPDLDDIAAKTEVIINPLSQLPWWVEISTTDPHCLYYFGPFTTADEAQFYQPGYIEDLQSEGAKGISVEVKQCQPQILTQEW